MAAARTSFAHCCSRARIDYNSKNPCYVFKAIISPDNSALAASLSNNAIKLYSCSVAGLSHVVDIPAHSATISDVQFPFSSLPQALYSCSRDGHVKAWDLRSRQLAERWVLGGQAELTSSSSSSGAMQTSATSCEAASPAYVASFSELSAPSRPGAWSHT
eukprot:GHRQ01016816.1.p1 GENE.GHRQ01016816.1~~GHRQ01016816.1.p1  ORF type:complete len:160 (+),score=45.90 GHRQ01016816.1:753-1232(+)